MKAKLILACVAAGAAVFGGTPATAEGSIGTISFMPGSAAPGQDVQLGGRCDAPGFTTARVISSVLDAPDLYGRDVGTGHPELLSHATVKKDAKPGKHRVSYKCGTQMINGEFWVSGTVKPGVVLTPARAKPGQQVTVRLNCPKLVPVTSSALVLDWMAPGEGRPDQIHFIGAGKVKNVKPGAYRVSAKCDGKTYSATLTVPGTGNAQVPVKPKGAPETGDA